MVYIYFLQITINLTINLSSKGDVIIQIVLTACI